MVFFTEIYTIYTKSIVAQIDLTHQVNHIHISVAGHDYATISILRCSHLIKRDHKLDYWVEKWVVSPLPWYQIFSGQIDWEFEIQEKVGVPISTAKGSQFRIVFSKQTSKEFKPGSSIILEQLVLKSDPLWEDTEGKSP
ncbi:hypothetical protein RCL_jg14612.t1 [Rhizophagus clarus]|uniref:Uncharacterized protein n=1 Tax=Rhizophagus clarus TaxID=94130 RepID=A0A8H3LX74_9GLOM|nr:hypothetical protein RCL_jg14612.t1 [Rhizophagus clarus]